MAKSKKESFDRSKVSGGARYHAQNNLNDLSNVEWLTFTKSVWQSRPPPRDELKEQHPATFAENDVEKLILFFTKKEEGCWILSWGLDRHWLPALILVVRG